MIYRLRDLLNEIPDREANSTTQAVLVAGSLAHLICVRNTLNNPAF